VPEAQSERREHEDDADVCHQPPPEVLPEEQDIHTHDDGYEEKHVEHDGGLSSHRLIVRSGRSPEAPRGATTASGGIIAGMGEAAGVTIRPWRVADRPAVQALLRLFSEDAEVTASDAPVYVAERDGVVVGMVALCVYTTLTGAKAYLDHLVVAPDSRRLGIGRALVAYAIERAKDAGASRVDLTARAAKQEAHALYRSLGFERRETVLLRRRIDRDAS
jgi:ribosomal protein S18 acetylase RimI-like enzyme